MDETKRTRTHFAASDIIANFQALFNALDFKTELNELGIGTLQIYRRHKVIREFKALTIALWSLALEKSFPEDAERFFARYLEMSPLLHDNQRNAEQMRGKINSYIDLLQEKKDTDFIPIASYLTEVLKLKPQEIISFRLKVSLMMRSLYTLIFNRLV